MLDLQIQVEDAILANLLYSETAREVAKEMDLQPKHFTDFHLTRSTRARFFKAIMAAPETGYIAVALQLEKMGEYQEHDTHRLLDLATLALSVTPDWNRQIEYIKKAWLDREIERMHKAGDYDGIASLLAGTNNYNSIYKGSVTKDTGKPWDV